MRQEDKRLRKKIFDIIEAAGEKSELSRWSEYYDIFMTVVIFLSIVPLAFTKGHFALEIIEWVATVIFIIDYILRWCTADYKLKDSRWMFKKIETGKKAFLVYPFTFWAIIDLLSILPGLYLVSQSFRVIRAARFLRLLRLLKAFRYDNEYLKGFKFFKKGMEAAKEDMIASLEVLVFLTLILAFLLYVVEHAAQPDVYKYPWDSLVWSFMSYLGNPGKFSPGDPVTVVGRMLWIIIALIKIALFAVPAGLIANGFREAMAKDKKDKKTKENAEKIKEYFNIDTFDRNNERFWPEQFERVADLQSLLHLSIEEIIASTEEDKELRLVNFASSFPEKAKGDPMAVEKLHVNNDYGFCYPTKKDDNNDDKELKSSVLVLAMTGNYRHGISYHAYHLARIGRFNFVSNEFIRYASPNAEHRVAPISVYDDIKYNYPIFNQYIEDILRLSDRNGWIIIITKTDTDKDATITCTVSGPKEEKSWDGAEITTVDDLETLKVFYQDLVQTLKSEDVTVDCKVYNSKETYMTKWLHSHGRNNVIQISFNRKFLYENRKALISVSKVINRHFETINKHGLNLIPHRALTVYKGREFDAVRLTKTSRNYFTLRFEPIEIKDARVLTLGFVLDYNSTMELEENNEKSIPINISNETFDDKQKDKIVTKTSPKQVTFKREGKFGFTLKRQLEILLKEGTYKCVVSKYNCEVTLTYEFTKLKKIYNEAGRTEKPEDKMVDNPFVDEKLCVNVDTFDSLGIPGLEEFNGFRVMHASEILYDGFIVEGQEFFGGDKKPHEQKVFFIKNESNEYGKSMIREMDES